jgi:hypothetical protein
VEALNLDAALAPAFSPPTTLNGSLDHPGDTDVYAFTATAFEDFIFDLSASGSLDARLFVVATATGDWIARNDDRSAGDTAPLIDAPMTEGGDLFLVVENINEEAAPLGYSIDVSQP